LTAIIARRVENATYWPTENRKVFMTR